MLRSSPSNRSWSVRLFRATVVAAAIGALHAPLAAAPESPRFARLSVEDGLSQSSVQQILQDRRGLMWFGTQEGLNRYDGYRFTVHRASGQPGFLGDHDITALIEDAAGDLWIGTSRGLYRHRLETGRFEACAPPVDGFAVLDLIQAGDGRILFTADGRLWVVDPADPERRAHPLHEGPFAALTGITALARGHGSTVWAAAQGRLFRVDMGADGGARLTEALADLGPVAVLAADPRGDLWIGRPDADLLRYRPADGRVDGFPQAPRNTLTILPGKGGEVWIGARRGGLARLDPASGELVVYRHDPGDTASLASDDVAAIYEDAVGSLWIGSWNGGVSRFDPHAQAFRTFRHSARNPHSLPADDIVLMAESPDGTLWVTSRGGIVGAGDPRSGRFRTVAALTDRRMTALGSLQDRLLVGTARGLILLGMAGGREAPLDPALLDHRLGERPVGAIRSGPDEAWIASGTALFRIHRDGRGALRVQDLRLPISGAVSALSPPADGRIWIGSDRGEVVRAEWAGPEAEVSLHPLALVEPGPDGGARGFVSALREDRHGRLWVGTRRGLGRVDLASGAVSWLGQAEGLPSTNIAAIEEDADGRLWLGHNRGLTRLDPAGGGMIHFGGPDGAQGKGYAEGASAAGSGLLYFAGEGVTVFDPREVTVGPHRPRIVFTALEVLHRVVAPRWLDPGSPLERAIGAQSEITLGPRAAVFSVEMAPLHYADPPSNRLMYRLDGFDPEWIETDAHHRVATYTNLPPGRYVLRARAGTKNGLWSEDEATLAIRILPPWWRTRSALTAWFALALVALALVWTASRRRARVRQALLERETLRRESLTDPLTGLHNRRFLVSWLGQEVPKVAREYRDGAAASPGSDLLLLLIDVDHFKAINDRYSHSVGDRVLTQIAGVLKEQIRGSDLAVRWGGDEFLVVTRGVQRTRAIDSAERLRAAVEASGAQLTADGGPACTVSVGFAPFPFLPHDPGGLTWEQTLDLADHALRLTKRARRNSSTGLRATAGLTAAAVLEFLRGPSGAPLPAGVEVVEP